MKKNLLALCFAIGTSSLFGQIWDGGLLDLQAFEQNTVITKTVDLSVESNSFLATSFLEEAILAGIALRKEEAVESL